MKLKFTLRRHNGAPPVDLMATVDTGATVGDLAERLWRADPLVRGSSPAGYGPGTGRATIVIDAGTSMAIDPSVRVADSGLHSGMSIGLTWTPEGYAAAHGETLAVVTVLGPGGRDLPVRSSSAVIGRDPDCAVVLSDSLVSRRHARLTIGALPEIVDLGSANGLEVNGAPATRAVLRPDDVVQLGDTQFTVRVLASATGRGADGAAEGHNRPPRLDPRYVGQAFDAPEPPKPPEAPRFPVIAAVTPLIMGGVLFLVTKSLYSLIFVLFSPLMVIGYAMETMLTGRSTFKKAVKRFRADLDEVSTQAASAAAEEVAARGREHPSLHECIDAIRRRSPLLWTRRPTDPGFGELRLGLGRQPSRSEITVPDRRDLPRDLMAEVHALRDRFRYVDAVPVLALPAEHGAIGLAGPRESVLGAARSLVAQAVALHSPAELVLVAFASEQRARDWQWLTWLPHTTSAHSPLESRAGRRDPVWPLAANQEDADALVSALEDLTAKRAADEAAQAPTVLVLVEDTVPVERSRLVDVAERGWRQGVIVLWLGEDVSHLPAACRHFVALHPGSPHAAAGFVHSAESVEPLQVELLDAATAVDLARRLAPLVDIGARVDDASDLPRTVSLLAIGDRPVSASPERVLESWQQNRSILSGPYGPTAPIRKAGTLRAVIGRTAAGPHAIDLREDGPHALVGGTTGSGKSELLQAWILAMAAAHSPQRLTFMLIDYKGGSAFTDLALLPHTVGLFTDLDPHLVRRALISLRAEFKARERLFARNQVKDLLELERKGVADVPPSLVIVVDEFAALIKELPDFIDGVVDVAQRGRSLGVHLILATQRPAGVIKENLRANTNLRLALRTADEADSVDVLGSPQAAHFDSANPGRAVSKTGPGRLVLFQAGYGGGWTSDAPPQPEILIEELRFGTRSLWEASEPEATLMDLGPTDIQRMIGAIDQATQAAGIRRPRQPWLPELKAAYDLWDVIRSVSGGRSDHELIFGVQDDPDKQAQPPIGYKPDEGNLAVYGTGGTGKSTLLRTLAIAAGTIVRGGPCWVYGLDFGNRGLAMLEDLPHVGSIVTGTDHDRIARLLKWLKGLVADRGERYSRAGAGTITDFRTIAGAAEEARILLMVDGVAAFRQAYETGDRAKLFEDFCQLASDGRAVGVHVIISADRPASVPSQLAAQIQTRIALRMADPQDYQSANVPVDVLKPTSPPGRGLLAGTELQVTVLGGAADNRSQTTAIKDFAEAMTRSGLRVITAPPIPNMPERVRLDSLPSTTDGRPVLGLLAETLQPLGFTPAGAFLVSGPPQSGRSAALRAIATSLRRWSPTMRLYLFTPGRRSDLAGLPLWTDRFLGQEPCRDGATKLLADLSGPVAVFIENVPEFTFAVAEAKMLELLAACRAEDVFVVGEGESKSLAGTSGLRDPLKASRYGLAFGPDFNDGDANFRTPFPHRLPRADFPPGRALFVHGGHTQVVGVGWVEEGG